MSLHFHRGFQLIDWRRFTISKFVNAKNVFKGKLNGKLTIAKNSDTTMKLPILTWVFARWHASLQNIATQLIT